MAKSAQSNRSSALPPAARPGASLFRNRRFKTAACILYLLIVTLLTYGSSLAPGRTFLPADLLLLRPPYAQHSQELSPGFREVARPVTDPLFQFYPMRKYLRDSLSCGRIPLWNPYSFSGTPFAADGQSAVFYPVNWLLPFLPLASSFAWIAALHTFLAGFFFWIWGRKLKWSDAGSLAGATVWMLCGPMTAWAMWQVVDAALCWLPLALYFWECYRENRKPGALAGAAAALAASALAGHMQFALYAWALALAYALYRPSLGGEAGGKMRSRIASAAAALGAFALASLLAGVQIFATLDFLGRSLRASSSLKELLATAMPVSQLSMLFAPGLFGGQRDDLVSMLFGPLQYHLGNMNVSGSAPYLGAVNFTELTCFCGASAFVFALMGLRLKERGDLSRLWTVLGALALLAGCGSPVYDLLYRFVPFFKSFHGAARSLALFDFCVAALCSAGIDRISRARADEAMRKTALNCAGIAVLLLLICFRLAMAQKAGPVDFGYLLTHDWAANGHLLRYLGGPLAMIALALAGVWGAKRFSAAPLVAVCAEMLLFAIGFNSSVSSSLLFPSTPETSYVSNALTATGGRVLCLANSQDNYQSRLMPNSAMALGWEDISGNDPLALASYDRFMRALNLFQSGREYPDGMGIIPAASSPALSALNLKYVIAPLGSGAPHFKLVRAGDVDIYQTENSSSEARLVHQAVVEPNDSELLRNFVSGGDPGGGKGVYLERSAPIALPGDNSEADRDWIGGIVRKPGAVRLDAATASNALLVLSEIDDPGWRATDNGRRIQPIQADGLFLCIPFGKGVHAIDLRYLPESIQFGLYATLAGISIAMAISFRAIAFALKNPADEVSARRRIAS